MTVTEQAVAVAEARLLLGDMPRIRAKWDAMIPALQNPITRGMVEAVQQRDAIFTRVVQNLLDVIDGE